MPKNTPRVVSLLCAATETVAALGLRDALAGRSHECDYPPDVESLPVCTAPRFDIHGTSSAIERDVQSLVRDGLSIYTVDTEMLRRLRPDVIITQDQCAVCAVSLKDVEAAVCDLTGVNAGIVSLNPNRLTDVWSDFRRIADALGAPEAATVLVDAVRGRLEAIRAQAAALDARPRLAVIEWLDPLMGAGNWMPELIEIAGGVPAFGSPGEHSPILDWDALVAADPDAILIAPCGLDMDRTARDLPLLTDRPGWHGLSAVKAGRVALADGHRFFNRPGPRLAESAEILAEFLHPRTFRFGHHGTAWDAVFGDRHGDARGDRAGAG